MKGKGGKKNKVGRKARKSADLYVQDRGTYYPCKIADKIDVWLKVHYIGFGQKDDEWVKSNDSRVKYEDPRDASLMDSSIDSTQPYASQGLPSADNVTNGEGSVTRGGKRSRVNDSLEENHSRKRMSIRPDVDPLLIPRISPSNPSTPSALQPNSHSTPPRTQQVESRQASRNDSVTSAENLIDHLAGVLTERSGLPPLQAASERTGGGAARNSATSSPTPVSELESNPSTAGEGGIDPDSSQCCKLCSHIISGESIVCSKCGGAFHARLSCLGVAQEVLSVLSSCRDRSVGYICCGCRVDSVSSTAGSLESIATALSQLLGVMKGMVSQFSEAMNELKLMRLQQNNPVSGSGRESEYSLHVPNPIVRDQVLESVKELNEREKRKDSIVLRGFGNIEVGRVQEKFNEVCTYLRLGSITLVDIVKINDSLFRAKVTSRDRFMQLLGESRRLRESDSLRNVYIQRDLTYLQRQQQISRRASRNSSQPLNEAASQWQLQLCVVSLANIPFCCYS